MYTWACRYIHDTTKSNNSFAAAPPELLLCNEDNAAGRDAQCVSHVTHMRKLYTYLYVYTHGYVGVYMYV